MCRACIAPPVRRLRFFLIPPPHDAGFQADRPPPLIFPPARCFFVVLFFFAILFGKYKLIVRLLQTIQGNVESDWSEVAQNR